LRQPETNKSVKLLETKVKAGEIAETNMKLPETTKKPQTNCNLSSFCPKWDRLSDILIGMTLFLQNNFLSK
jgi:hypothetical protein